MADYFTSDLHLRHPKVAELRGFDSELEHDATVIGNIHEALQDGDRLWILGDVSGGAGEREALNLISDLHAFKSVKLNLVSGNHDSTHPMHRNSEDRQAYFREVFDSIDSFGTFRHNKSSVLMSHFPYEADRGATRYPEFRLTDRGLPIVHGHTHSSEKVSESLTGSKQIHVGLDAWDLKPVKKETITRLIDLPPTEG